MRLSLGRSGVQLLGGLCIAMVCLGVYISLGEERTLGTSSLPTLETPEVEGAADSQMPLSSREVLVLESESQPPRLISTRQYLQDYWGARWLEIEASLLDAGWDLDEEIDLSLWPKWEEVKELAFATMVSNEATIDPLAAGDISGMRKTVGAALLMPLGDRISLAVDRKLNPDGKNISKLQRDHLLEIEARHNEGLGPLVDVYLVANQAYRINQLELGNFEYGLFALPKHAKDPNYSGMTDMITGSTGGWNYAMYLEVEKDPALSSLLSEIDYLTVSKKAELALLIESF